MNDPCKSDNSKGNALVCPLIGMSATLLGTSLEQWRKMVEAIVNVLATMTMTQEEIRKKMKMTEEERIELVELYRRSQNTPMIALSVADGLAGNDFASQAQRRFQERWQEICFKYKLYPDETGFNSKTGEFVK